MEGREDRHDGRFPGGKGHVRGRGRRNPAEKAAEYAALQDSVDAAAARGYVDTVIEAQDTRKYVIGAFEMLFTKREDRPAKKHGTV